MSFNNQGLIDLAANPDPRNFIAELIPLLRDMDACRQRANAFIDKWAEGGQICTVENLQGMLHHTSRLLPVLLAGENTFTINSPAINLPGYHCHIFDFTPNQIIASENKQDAGDSTTYDTPALPPKFSRKRSRSLGEDDVASEESPSPKRQKSDEENFSPVASSSRLDPSTPPRAHKISGRSNSKRSGDHIEMRHPMVARALLQEEEDSDMNDSEEDLNGAEEAQEPAHAPPAVVVIQPAAPSALAAAAKNTTRITLTIRIPALSKNITRARSAPATPRRSARNASNKADERPA